MKCLVFSDSHGVSFYMKKAIECHKDAEAVFFLGDGIRDFHEISATFPDKAFIAVRGNCDFSYEINGVEVPKVDSITLEGKRIFLTHGDLYGAKYGTAGLESFAEGRGADIVLFGHTHTPLERYINTEEKYKDKLGEEDFLLPPSYYLLNPGSIGQGSPKTYGVLTLAESGVLFSIGKFL